MTITETILKEWKEKWPYPQHHVDEDGDWMEMVGTEMDAFLSTIPARVVEAIRGEMKWAGNADSGMEMNAAGYNKANEDFNKILDSII